MKIGLRLYGTDPDGLIEVARTAEDLGYESLWRGEHLVVPESFGSAYPFAAGAPFRADDPMLDAIGVFSFVAGVTERIRLATGIYLLALRHPVVTARAVVTLDVLSKGRAILGVGAGWLAEEFDLLGVDFDRRGALMSEHLATMKELWTSPTPSLPAAAGQRHEVRFEPKPVQRPHPPVVVGGETPAAIRRAAREGDGWYGHDLTVERVEALRATIDRERAAVGRTSPFEITIRARADLTVDAVRRYADAGVDRIVLEIGSLATIDPREDLAVVEAFADAVVRSVS